MFNGVGDVDLLAVNASFGQTAVEQFAGRTDEWFAHQVFVVPGLLADQENPGFGRSFAEDSLCADFPEGTTLATVAAVFNLQGGMRRNERSGAPHLSFPLTTCMLYSHTKHKDHKEEGRDRTELLKIGAIALRSIEHRTGMPELFALD